jgi:hypothetical protein
MDSAGNQELIRDTQVHPLAMAMLACAGLIVLLGSRRSAAVAILFVACFVSSGQDIVIFGISLYALRILILLGIIRVFVRSEIQSLRLNRVDAVMLLWCGVGITAYTLQQVSFSGFVFKMGQSVDATGAYIVFRCLMRGVEDLKAIIRWQAILAIPVALVFLLENATRYNLFSIFGGVPELTPQREGRFRCQGAFSHAILAGTFWASTLPLMIGLWWGAAKGRLIFAVGAGCGLLVIVLCASSTPLLGVFTVVIGLSLFFLRLRMRVIRWGGVGLLVLLQIVMKAPVWSLLGRIQLVAGSTGYYRYKLVDAAISHVGDWFLVGMASNADWGNEWGHYLTDITNQYILEGLRGGIITLGFFVAIICFCFGRVGSLIRAANSRQERILYWCLGVTLAVHAVCFMAVSYFGQIVMLFNLHLALIASMPLSRTKTKSVVKATRASRPGHVVAMAPDVQYA